MSFRSFFWAQKDFSDRLLNSSILTQREKEREMKDFIVNLHAEVTSILDSINRKKHTRCDRSFDKDKLLYSSVDAFRYLIAIMNLWGITSYEFEDAFWTKDEFLNFRSIIEENLWQGQQVLVVDIDDVLSNFRHDFYTWMKLQQNIEVDENSSEYYHTKDVNGKEISSDHLFEEFIHQGGLKKLSSNESIIDAINSLVRDGMWIQLVTSRPEKNLRCKYDTWNWLKDNGVSFSGLSFTSEKFLWLSRTNFFLENKVVCAIDDSPKHAVEYANHGIHVLMPNKSYNQDVKHSNIVKYDDSETMNLMVQKYLRER